MNLDPSHSDADLGGVYTREALMDRWKCSGRTLERLAGRLHPMRPGKFTLYPTWAVAQYERELQEIHEPVSKARGELRAMKREIRLKARGY